jgi:hypothetical protein
MVKIVDETQVKFVCTSRVLKQRRAAFLEERNFAIYADGGEQRRYKARNEILRWIAL